MTDSRRCAECGERRGARSVLARVSHGYGAANDAVHWFCSVECRAFWRSDDDTRQATLGEFVEGRLAPIVGSPDDLGGSVAEPIEPVSVSAQEDGAEPVLVTDGGRDPERSEGVLSRLDGRHYGDDVEGEDYSDLTGEAPLCGDCGKRQAVERVDGVDLCSQCVEDPRVFECGACGASTTEHGECHECGALPFEDGDQA